MLNVKKKKMVPKDTSNAKKLQKKASEDLNEAVDSEEGNSEPDEDSNNEELDFDCGDDFLDAIQGSSSKRKLDSIKDDEEDGDGVAEIDGQLPPKKKKKKKATTVNIKPPTAEEMMRLRETENLFHSNLFRMQIEEMIKEVKPKKIERKQMKSWLESLREFILNIDDSKQTELHESCLPKNVNFPLPPLPPQETKLSSYFMKPISMSVVGSYHAGCSLGPSLSVDVAVVMPKKCFLKEDYLNARYSQKRAAYLTHLASALLSSDLVDQEQGIRWSQTCGDVLSPSLLLWPAGRLSKVRVFVSAVPQQATFKLSRFMPDKNNIRGFWITQGQLDDCSTATPVYNTSVMRDLVSSANEAVRSQALENNKNLKEAVILLRVWLRQRNLDEGAGCFSGFLVSMLVVALSLSRRINALMSSYQIVRNVWLVLSQTDWTKEGLTLCSAKKEDTAPSLQDFHSHFDVVFVDTTGYCNLAAGVHRLSYLRVKQEAQLAVQCLDNPDMNSFQALFMTPMPFLRQFDHIIRLKLLKKTYVLKQVLDKEATQEEHINHFVSQKTLFINIVTRVLEQGVGSRLVQLAYELRPVLHWKVSDKPRLDNRCVMIGLRLNPETAYSVVEKGPPANEPQAAEFRTLWGTRCELRRFRDGVVCETVVAAEPTAPLAERRLVTKQMALWLLHERLLLPKPAVKYIASQLESLVVEKAFLPAGFKYGSGEEAAHAVIQAFDRLSKQLRELPDMPLDITSVQGVSPVFRGAEVFPPLAGSGKPLAKLALQAKTCWMLPENLSKTPDFIPPVEGVLQLGLSRKWPEDLEAVRRIRAAFNLHVAKALLEQYDIQTQAYPDYVDIFKDGFVFRIRIIYPREVALLKESVTPDGKLCYRDTPESLQLDRFISHLPKLTGALHGLQQQWPSFGVASRLAKRWLSSQLLDCSHVPEMATELLMASLFLSPEPFHPLAQPQPMFLRFLHMLAHTNWHTEPIIVNFNGDLKREDLVEIESRFRSERASLPPLFIATQYDKTGCVWTRDAPLLPVLVRLANLAKEALSLLEVSLPQTPLAVFRPPLELYDALIRLKPILLPRCVHGVHFICKQPYQLRIPQKRTRIPITGFDPAQCYLQELRESYSDYALFFHDTFGGLTIGVLFKPSAFEKQDFKVSHVNCRKPVTEDKKTVLSLNLSAIIEDFYILGAGLVKTIDLSTTCSQKL